MGIKIVSQPIGAPIIAAASTAMAQANQRTAEQQGLMWRQQVAHKYKTKALEDTRTFEAEEDAFKFGRDSSMRPMPKGVGLNPSAAKTYGMLQAEAREIYGGMKVDPRSDEAKKRLAEIEARMRAMEEWNPDPRPEEEFDRGRIFIDPKGSRLAPDGTPYKVMPEGGSELRLNPKTGNYDPAPLSPAEEQAAEIAKENRTSEAAIAKKAEEQAKKMLLNRWNTQKKIAERNLNEKIKKLQDSTTDRSEEIQKLEEEFVDKWSNPPDEFGAAAPVAVPDSAVTPTPIAIPGSQGPGPASTPVPVAQPGSQGVGAAMTPTPIATPGVSTPAAPAPPSAVPGAAAPAPAVPDTVTPKQVSDELNALMDQMKEAGKTINDLSDADKAYIDELVRRLKGA